jgi:tRNA1Val (adenine37-N6)-methyltransferase
MKSSTLDTFFDGQLRIRQDSSGYRFSIDAVLLAYHANPRAGERLLDLGSGCGIISLILAYRHPGVDIYGVEIQAELANLALENVSDNHMQDRITILCQDMRKLKPEMINGLFDLIVCNPPYRKSNSGRINPDRQRAVARHEIQVTLCDVLEAAGRMLRPAGRFIIIYTAERVTELLHKMRLARIEPKYLRAIHSQLDSAAKLILIEGIKGARTGTRIAPPLIVYDKEGEYSAEVQQMFVL